MTESTDRVDLATKWMRRVARIWSVIVIGFTLFMAIAHLVAPEPEAAAVDFPPIEFLLPIVMFVSVMGLAVAWRWEGLGGAVNVGFFVAFTGLFWLIRGEPFPLMSMPIFLAAVVPGILFLICWWRTRSRSRRMRHPFDAGQ